MNQIKHGHNTLSIGDIEHARARIAEQIVTTALQYSETLSKHTSRNDATVAPSEGHLESSVYLKLECLQTTGSFKLRGATNAIMSLSAEERKRGVVCVSTGNHGRGIAYAAKQNNIPAIVCMGSLVPQNKIDGIRALGAEVRIVGQNQDDAQAEADRLVAEEGMVMLPPFDHPHVIAGQGSVGLEILDQLGEIDTLVVPMSGGGLLSGVACAVRAKSPSTRIIGASMERGCAMHMSLEAGHPVPVDEFPSLADALGGGIGLNNQYTFHMIQQLVDDTVLVSEEDIANAVHHAYFYERQIIEGSAAVGIAALLSNRLEVKGNTVIIVSGKNVNMDTHIELINGNIPDRYRT